MILRVKSHRAADKLERIVGTLDWYYTIRDGGTFVRVSDDLADECLTVKSVARARPNGELRKCVKW